MLRPENLYIQMIYKTGLSDKVNYIVKEFDWNICKEGFTKLDNCSGNVMYHG
jgi:hypothetical protein